MRQGFRAFRIQGSRLEFRLAKNLAQTAVDDNGGSNYVIESPGRYVIVRNAPPQRVGDADVRECLRTLRPKDKYFEIFYEPDLLWRKCLVTYSVNSSLPWRNAPMDMVTSDGRYWFHRVEMLNSVEFAFTDGQGEWDNNESRNYSVFLPGKYIVKKKGMFYCGPSDLDQHLY